MLPSQQRILENGVAIFARKGYGNTGLRELAEQAGVNLAMINYFFGSKKGLLKEILDSFLSRYLEIARQELCSKGDVDQKVRRFMERVIPFIRENKDYFIVTLTELPHDDPDIIEHKAAWIRKIVELVQSQICEPLSEKSGKEITPYLIGPVMIGMVAMRFLVEPIFEKIKPFDLDEDYYSQYPQLVAEIFLNGIHGATDLISENRK
jgi:AcrR family transcriptional regulator